MADYNSDRTGSNIDAVLDKADNLTQAAVGVGGNVGIGTASPTSLGSNIKTLELKGGSNDRTGGVRVTSFDNSSDGYFYGAGGLLNFGSATATPISFLTAGSERARIDSSGNLLVGTTSSPTGSGQIVANNGIYLGGTGAANKLDDYEEGFWDVTNDGDATGVISGQLGQYTKIGSLVQVQFQVQTTTDFSSNSMAGLPFIPKIASGISNRYGVYPVFSGQGGGELIYATITDTNDQILFYKGDTTTTFNPTSVSTAYRVCMTYETNE